jgi:uncharacterized membrane protein
MDRALQCTGTVSRVSAAREVSVRMNVGNLERIGSVAAGAALLYLSRRRMAPIKGANAAGAGLIARGVLGYCPVNALCGRDSRSRDTRKALSGTRGVRVLETVVVRAEPAVAYRFWRNLSNLPRFMNHLERVDVIDSRRSHWSAYGPAGTRAEWDAEIINDIPNQLIAWKSSEKADVVSAGSVRFRPAPGGTEITVHLQYDLPAGQVGEWIAEAFGQAPSQTIREDLWRLKAHFEAPVTVEA